MIFRPSGLRLIVLSNALPRHALWSRNASNWGQHSTFPTFFHRAPAYRHSLRDHLLWLVPLAGGLIVYRSASPKPSPNVFASPVLIPCPAPKPFNETQPMILSPAEPQRSILSRIVALLRDRIWEPIRTGFRFMYLFALFLPVIVSAPMVLVGTPEKYHDERWGAVWWYGLLVRQMQAAGPTFIKVFDHSYNGSRVSMN
jgi:aarF domain-containing kinase